MQIVSPVESLIKHALQRGNEPFLFQPLNADGDMKIYTYAETLEHVARTAAYLKQVAQAGDRIALLGKNTAEWMIIDWAVQWAEMILVPLYPTASWSQNLRSMQSVDARILFVGKLDKPLVLEPRPAEIQTVIGLPLSEGEVDVRWQQVQACEPLRFDCYQQPDLETIFSLLFTSGTHGEAKAVKLSYRAYHYTCSQVVSAIGVNTSDRLFSYLPLAHIAERMMIQGTALLSGAQLHFAHSLDTFVHDLQRSQPTAFMSVPRLWQKFQQAIQSRFPEPLLALLLRLPVIGGLLKRKIRQVLGLSHARLCGAGAAAMQPELLRWYERLGIPISEAWGLSETCGLVTMNFPYQSSRCGGIGEALPQTEIKLTESNELLVRSPGLFSGYWGEEQPGLDVDGYFHTGDQGYFDAASQSWYLTGRLKDNFKTSKGKFIAPAKIEGQLLSFAEVEQACVIEGLAGQPIAILQANPDRLIDARGERRLLNILDQINQNLEPHEQLQRLIVSCFPWERVGGLLTPTMKVRRQQVKARFADYIFDEQRLVVLNHPPARNKGSAVDFA